MTTPCKFVVAALLSTLAFGAVAKPHHPVRHHHHRVVHHHHHHHHPR
jgi:hypothetical protein